MHLICTHEQADFDAVASLWAAAMLDSEAKAVLPHRLNRNVRGFLTLYGEHFSFIDSKELTGQPIGRITLVDTQSLVSLKGVHTSTAVHIIDHHPPEDTLDSAWSVNVEQLGASVTLLVESLQESDRQLDSPTATLLMLGIYEDTGSLTYPSTTARDVAAAAWLLQRGASLEVLSDFINPPLSQEQQALYEKLLESVKLQRVRGLQIVVAQAETSGTSDEVSTLAHKLGDLFDASGLFLLVGLEAGIQVVARSYSDLLNVGEVAAKLGGGGHARAAAALVKGGGLDEVRLKVLAVLEQVIESPSTVAEIMSRGPQLLRAAQTIEEAADEMQRHGHEGYPVTDNGQIVGLLTRRAVDRAMSHGMQKRPVSEIMNAGSLVVYPHDTVRELQRLMIEHQWGQVPVSDPESGKIIGIVTRTDVLNSLSIESNSKPNTSLKDKLESALPGGRLALLKRIAQEAKASGAALYIVGGFVRDLLLGTPSIDFDLVVEGNAIVLAEQLCAKYGGQVNSHRRFGTAKWGIDPSNEELRSALGLEGDIPSTVDFVTARAEFYSHPTALPSVTEGSIKLDLHRRDFSINTLAMRLDGRHYGQLLDYWGGGRDLREQQIRVLHSLSFVDDPTRMLRAVRLEQRLGFRIEARTLELMEQALPLLNSVSGERIRGELAAMLQEPQVGRIMARLDELGLMQAIHPALSWDDWLALRLEMARSWTPPEVWRLEHPPELEHLALALWVYRLNQERADSVCERLNLGQAAQAVVRRAGRYGCDLELDHSPSSVVACLESEPEQALVATWLASVDMPASQAAIESYLSEWRWVRPLTSGDSLRALGLAAGPAYGEILRQLRDAWLDGQVSDQAQETRLLEKLLEGLQRDG